MNCEADCDETDDVANEDDVDARMVGESDDDRRSPFEFVICAMLASAPRGSSAGEVVKGSKTLSIQGENKFSPKWVAEDGEWVDIDSNAGEAGDRPPEFMASDKICSWW